MATATHNGINLALTFEEADALYDALGAMSKQSWETAGISGEKYNAVNRIFTAIADVIDEE